MTDPNAALAQLLAIHTQRTTEALTAIHSTVERIADALDDRAAAALAPAAVFGAKPSDVAEVYAMEKRIRDEIIREMADADALASTTRPPPAPPRPPPGSRPSTPPSRRRRQPEPRDEARRAERR